MTGADSSLITVIMGAGMGKRMKSDLPKVLHPLAGKPLVHRVIDLGRALESDRILLVVGYRRELVMDATRGLGVEWVVQDPQLGTGDALKVCLPNLDGFNGDLLVLAGDVPLITTKTVTSALELHRESGSAATVFSFIPEDASGYGRIIRGRDDQLLGIVEHKDANAEQKRIREVNSAVYIFKASEVLPTLDLLTADNAAGEFYLTDSIGILASQGKRLSVYLVEDPLEVAGVNSVEQLAALEREWLARRAAPI